MASAASLSLSLSKLQLSASAGVSSPQPSRASSHRSAATLSVETAFQGLRVSPFARKQSGGELLAARVAQEVLLPASGRSGSSKAAVSMSFEVGVGIMGTKMGMMTYFTEDGKAVPVTVVGLHEGNIVSQVKTPSTDGYSAVQVAYRRVRDTKLTKPELGHLAKSEILPMRHLQEFRLDSVEGFEPGQRLDIDSLFKPGDLVDVSGTSIGKGFAGGIKRWNFARGLMSHGSKSHRQLGSIGAGTTPGRVYPGKKMPGQLGNQKTKIRKLEVIKVDSELHAILIKGGVPGKAGNLLRITPAKIVGGKKPKSA